MGMKAPTEKEIQSAILLWLRIKGAVAVRVNSGAFAGEHNGKKRFVRMNDTPGCSDILACVNGVFVAIEVKRPGAKTNPVRAAKQQAFIDAVKKANGIAVIAESISDVVAALLRHDKEQEG